MSHYKSNIWKYFKVGTKSTQPNQAECILCSKTSKSRFISWGKRPRTNKTKPLWDHLKDKHQHVYTIQRQMIQENNESTPDDPPEPEEPDPTHSDEPDSPQKSNTSPSKQSDRSQSPRSETPDTPQAKRSRPSHSQSSDSPHSKKSDTPQSNSSDVPQSRKTNPPQPDGPHSDEPDSPQSESPDAPRSKKSNLSQSQSSDSTQSESADAPQSKKLDAPQSNSSDTPRSKSSDTPQSKSSDTPQSKSSDTPQSKSSDTPQSKSSDAPQSRKSDTPQSKSSDTPQSKSSDTPQSKSSDTPQSKSSDTPQSKSSDTPQSKSSDTPQSKSSDTPQSKSSDTPQPKSSDTPQSKSSDTPQSKSSDTPRSRKSDTPPPKESDTPQSKSSDTPRSKNSDPSKSKESDSSQSKSSDTPRSRKSDAPPPKESDPPQSRNSEPVQSKKSDPPQSRTSDPPPPKKRPLTMQQRIRLVQQQTTPDVIDEPPATQNQAPATQNQAPATPDHQRVTANHRMTNGNNDDDEPLLSRARKRRRTRAAEEEIIAVEPPPSQPNVPQLIDLGPESPEETTANHHSIPMLAGTSNGGGLGGALVAGTSNRDEMEDVILKAVMECAMVWEPHDPRAEAVSIKIGEMMVLDGEPCTVVEREGFCGLLRSVVPRYLIPDTSHFYGTILPNLYHSVKSQAKDRLKLASHVSFTTDKWTSTKNNGSFIVLKAHFISPDDFTAHTLVLSCEHSPASHKDVIVAEMVNQSLGDWVIIPSQTHVILQDNTANNTFTTALTPAEEVECFYHTLQLVVQEAVLEQRTVSDIITKGREIVNHFNRSTHASIKLRIIQNNLQRPTSEIQPDVPMRWNSTFTMLEQLYEQRQTVTVYATENDIPILTACEWILVWRILSVLRPFEAVSKQACVETEIISYAIPAVATLHTYLSKHQPDPVVEIMKEQLKLSLESYFSPDPKSGTGKRILGKKCFVFATLLDPRFKSKFLTDPMPALDRITEEYQKSIVSESDEVDEAVLNDANEDIWETYNEIIERDTDTVNSNEDTKPRIDPTTGHVLDSSAPQPSVRHDLRTTRKTAAFRAELEKYLSVPVIPRQEDPLAWWKWHAAEYPKLAQMVLKYLCAPATLLNSEKTFKEAKTIYTENRNKLSISNAEKFIFIMRNKKYLGLS